MGYWDYRARLAFIQTIREACQHERVFGRIYQALAARADEDSMRDLWLKLAETAQSHAEHDAARLHQMGVKPVPDVETWGEQLWRKILVRSGPSSALAWIERTRQHDVQRLLSFALMASEARTQAVTNTKPLL